MFNNSSIQNIHAHASRLYTSGRMLEAETYIKNMLGQYPKDAFLLNIMAAVYVAKNDWKNALKFYQKAARRKPDDIQILRNLAMAQQSTGDFTAAKQTLTKALKLRPGFAEGWKLLGSIYMEQKETDKYLQCLTKALKLKPDYLEAAAALLSETEAQNDLEGLRARLSEFGERFKGNPIVELYQGVLLFREKEYKKAQQTLNGLSFSTAIQKREREYELLRLHTLAQIADKLGEYPAAFEKFEQMNAVRLLMTPSSKYSAEGYRNRLQAHERYFTANTVNKWEPLEASAASPVFMVGFPRSGTTLLDTFLRGHKDIEVLEEMPLVLDMVTKMGLNSEEDLRELEKLGKTAALKAASGYLKAQRKLGGNSHVIVDRAPFNTLFIGEIQRIFPNAKFILAIRDPADVVLSSFMQNFVINDANANLTTPLDAAKTYDALMSLWVQYNEVFELNSIICRYEDVVENAEDALRPVIDFLDLDWDPRLLAHQKTAASRDRINTASYSQVVQPIYKTALRRWEHYADLMPEALEILEPWRKYFGYAE